LRIFYFNLGVGSGIEKTGNVIKDLLPEEDEIYEYRYQNPPCLIIHELVNFKPDVILMNEFFPRVCVASYYYKVTNPEVKIILCNHCFDILLGAPSRNISGISHDVSITIDRFFRDYVDYIINLNCKMNRLIPSIDRKTFYHYHPISDVYKVTKRWSDRDKNFVYFGSIVEHKIDPEFLVLLGNTKISLDIIGRESKSDLINSIIDKYDNLRYIGFVDEEDLPNTLNEYKWYVSPHNGREPFNLSLAESMRCGVIPITTAKGEWFSWAREESVCVDSYEDMIDFMNKIDCIDDRYYSEFSKNMSESIIKKTNTRNFTDLLEELIHDRKY